jgi:cell division septum initiation protein DivIVA
MARATPLREYMMDELEKLKKENERLRQQVEKLKAECDELSDLFATRSRTAEARFKKLCALCRRT